MIRTQSTYEPSVEVVDQSITEDDSLLARPMHLPRRSLQPNHLQLHPSHNSTVLATPVAADTTSPMFANLMKPARQHTDSLPLLGGMEKNLDETMSTVNEGTLKEEDHEQEGQEALWVEQQNHGMNDPASALGTPIATTATPKSLGLFRKKRSSLPASPTRAGATASPSPLQRKSSGLFQDKRFSAPHIVLLGTFPEAENRPNENVVVGTVSPSGKGATRGGVISPSVPTVHSPHVIPASDTISTLGFDKSFDDIKSNNTTSPLSMSSLNAIMDGPVTPAAGALLTLSAPTEKKGLKSWLKPGASAAPRGVKPATVVVAASSPKASPWKKWKQSRRASPRDEARFQRYAATVVDKSGANATLDDSFEHEIEPDRGTTLDVSIVQMDERLQTALRHAMDHDDAHSLTSYDGVSLHTEEKKSTGRNVVVPPPGTPPKSNPAGRFAALQPTFVAASASDTGVLLALAKSWEHETLLDESLTELPSPTAVSTESNEGTLTSGGDTNESDSLRSVSPNGATAAMMRKSPTEPVDLDTTVDEESADGNLHPAPATPLKLLTSPASSTADSADRYTVAEERSTANGSFSDDDTGAADKYSVLSDPCSFCESLWISTSKSKHMSQFTNSTMSSSPLSTTSSPVDSQENSFQARQLSNAAPSTDKYSEVPDVIPANSSGLSSCAGETEGKKSQKSPLRLAAAAGVVTGLLDKLKRSTPGRKTADASPAPSQRTTPTRQRMTPTRQAKPSPSTSVRSKSSVAPPPQRTPPRALGNRSFSRSPLQQRKAAATPPPTFKPLPPPSGSPGGRLFARKSILKEPKVTDTASVMAATSAAVVTTAAVVEPPSIERYHRVSTAQLLETEGPHRVTVFTSDAIDANNGSRDVAKQTLHDSDRPVEDSSTTGSSSVDEDASLQNMYQDPLVDRLKGPLRPTRGMDPDTAGAEVMGRLQLDP